MDSDDIIDVYKERFRKINRHKDRLLKDFEPSEIHHFRVEIKKLRAFMRLLSAGFRAHKIRLSRDIKSFYHMAGLIRNLQLYQSRISSLCDELSIQKPSLYLQSLKEEEKRLRLATSQVAENISWKAFEKEIIDNVPPRLGGKTIKTFIRQRKAKLEELFSLPAYYEDTLHSIRKQLKDLMYDSKYTAAALTVSFPRQFRSIKSLEPLTTTLGEVFDLYSSLNVLSSSDANNITDVDELSSIARLKQQLQLIRDQMKEKVIGQLLLLKQALIRGLEV